MSGLSGMVFSKRRGRLLKTGQTTQYNSELDDGYYEKGLAKAYDIRTTDQYSGTVNVDLIHYTAATISFMATTLVLDSANGLAQFKAGDVIVITGSPLNSGVYTVVTGNVASAIEVAETTIVNEDAGATVSIAKREAMSNNCVFDKNTGLTWLRYQPTKFGTASDGNMPWTGQLYDIFQFAAAANTALLGGFSAAELAADPWRVPNWKELWSLIDQSQDKPDATAFPSFGSSFTSTSRFDATTYAWIVPNTTAGTLKTSAKLVLLVRGG